MNVTFSQDTILLVHRAISGHHVMKILAMDSGVELVKNFKFEYYGDGGPYLNSLYSKEVSPLIGCLSPVLTVPV